MLAIVSDVHGNLEALDAVLARVEGFPILCLGDVVCYGPDSIACVRKSSHWTSVVAGPMDLALINHNPDEWNPTLNRYIELLRKRFAEAHDAETLRTILTSYNSEYCSDGLWYFHGAPGNVRDWIFPESIYSPSKLDQLVASPAHAFIGGGSHIPGIFRRSNNDWEFTQPTNDVWYDLPQDEKTIVTVGSTGQPRDDDSRASYAILDGPRIAFHRVEYDLETTLRKIKDDPDIDDFHGERLPHGR